MNFIIHMYYVCEYAKIKNKTWQVRSFYADDCFDNLIVHVNGVQKSSSIDRVGWSGIPISGWDWPITRTCVMRNRLPWCMLQLFIKPKLVIVSVLCLRAVMETIVCQCILSKKLSPISPNLNRDYPSRREGHNLIASKFGNLGNSNSVVLQSH